MKRSISPLSDSKSTLPDIRNIKRKLNEINPNYHPSHHNKHNNKSKQDEEIIKLLNIKNHDVCDACGDVGEFLCCDACPNSFHFTCVEPPMNSTDVENLKDKWYCNECEQKRNKPRKSNTTAQYGIFNDLIDGLLTKNPKSYRLPDNIVHFFDGVSSDKQGKYIDTLQIKKVKHKNGQMEQPDYYQLKDKSGKFILCYHCRKTCLKKPIISCDYCSLYWHLDCLNPPLSSPPNLTKKWRCPNHIENIIKPPRKQKGSVIVIQEKTPNCTYLNEITDDSNNGAVQSDHSNSLQEDINDSIITRNDGQVYQLPINSFQMDLKSYLKKQVKIITKSTNHIDRRNSIPSTLTSSSSSEVSTPPITFASPITSHSKPILNTATLDNPSSSTGKKILIQQLLNPDKDHVLNLIKIITKSTTTINTSPSTPTPFSYSTNGKSMNAEKYKKYLEIESLLKQKNENELLTLLLE